MPLQTVSPRIEECIRRVFSEIARRKVPNVILYRYEGLPQQVSHDIDVLADADAVRAIEEVFCEVTEDLDLLLTRRYGQTSRNVTIEAYDCDAPTDRYPRVALHMKTFVTYWFRGRVPTLVWAERICAQRRTVINRGIELSVLKPEWEFALLLAQWLTVYGRKVKESHAQRLYELLFDPDVAAWLTQTLSESEVTSLAECFTELTHDGVHDKSIRLLSAMNL